MIYTVYNSHSPVGMNTLFIHTSIVPHSTEGVFDLCNIADLLIYSLLVKSMTTFIIFTINEQIQNIAQKKDTLCRRMYN